MPGLYSHTTRGPGTTLTATIYNTDHQNHIDNHVPDQMDDYSSTVGEMQSTFDPGDVGSENQPGSLADELRGIRFTIKAMLGAAQWYVPPLVTLTTLRNVQTGAEKGILSMKEFC